MWSKNIFAVAALLGICSASFGQPTEEPTQGEQNTNTTYLVITEASFAHVDSPDPPKTYPIPKLLPDIWSDDGRYRTTAIGWYKIDLPNIQPRNWALLMPKFTQNVEVYLNGMKIGDTDVLQRQTINWNRPFLFPLPDNYWKGNDNKLEIRLSTMPNWGVLAPFLLGPTTQLTPMYERAYFFQITVNQIATWMSLLLGLIVLVYWIADRATTSYAWYAAAAFGTAVYAANNHLTEFPISVPVWSAFLHTSVDFYAVSMVMFVHRFFALKRPKTEILLGLFLLGATISYIFSYFIFETRAPQLPHIVSALTGFYTTATAINQSIKSFDYRKLALALALGFILLLYIHDNLFSRALLPIGDEIPFYLAQLGIPLLLAFILLVLTRDFVRALVQAKLANQNLEQRVAAIGRRLEESYEEQRELEREQATLVERQRIYTDLHDDLGAKLLSIIYESTDANTQTLARSAISDMRSIINFTPGSGVVDNLEAIWHSEARQRCEQTGVELHWVGSSTLKCSEHAAHHLTRVIREIVTNALKHSGCRHLSIEVQDLSSELRICIEDDGKGMPEVFSGSGTHGAKHRIEELDGNIVWQPGNLSGTLVRVSVPKRSLT